MRHIHPQAQPISKPSASPLLFSITSSHLSRSRQMSASIYREIQEKNQSIKKKFFLEEAEKKRRKNRKQQTRNHVADCSNCFSVFSASIFIHFSFLFFLLLHSLWKEIKNKLDVKEEKRFHRVFSSGQYGK